MMRDMLEFHVNKYHREKQIKWWQCFHKNHGWISGFRVAKNHVSRSWAITTFERERQREMWRWELTVSHSSPSANLGHTGAFGFLKLILLETASRTGCSHPIPSPQKKFITESPSAAIILEELCIFVILQKGFIREFCVLFWGGGKNMARKWHTFVRSPEKNPKAKS